MSYHKPVLLSESIDSLEIRCDGVYVDMTYGGGGHSREILKKLGIFLILKLLYHQERDLVL